MEVGFIQQILFTCIAHTLEKIFGSTWNFTMSIIFGVDHEPVIISGDREVKFRDREVNQFIEIALSLKISSQSS